LVLPTFAYIDIVPKYKRTQEIGKLAIIVITIAEIISNTSNSLILEVLKVKLKQIVKLPFTL